jgi:Fe-S-cluster containining protein
MTSAEYEDLLARVDVTCGEIAERRSADLECRLGCTMCCNVQLTLSAVEADSVRLALAALEPGSRERIRERARALAAEGDPEEDEPCAMLEANGACAIHSARPLACRTQGHALLYPRGTVPQASVYATTKGGEITWCPLNYTEGKPNSEDVLQVGLIDASLAQINRRADAARARERVSMVDLALG